LLGGAVESFGSAARRISRLLRSMYKKLKESIEEALNPIFWI
jgi:hypothetical protein